MINLLFTLFISMFSICSYDYSLDHYENNENVIVTDSIPSKSLYANTQYAYVGLSEVGSYDFYLYFLTEIQKNEYIYNSGRTIDDFLNGDSFYCDLSSHNIYFGNINSYNGLYELQNPIIGFYCDIDRSPTYRDSIEYRFYYGNSSQYRSVECNIFYQDTAKTMPSSCSATFYVGNQEPSYYDNMCIRYAVEEFRGLFPQNFVDIEYNNNYADIYNTGFDDGHSIGYQDGYTIGFNEASSIDSTASTIFTGILDVALIPVNVFLTIFNFEVFGINIAGIVSALLTVSVVVIIFRFVFGGKKDD